MMHDKVGQHLISRAVKLTISKQKKYYTNEMILIFLLKVINVPKCDLFKFKCNFFS